MDTPATDEPRLLGDEGDPEWKEKVSLQGGTDRCLSEHPELPPVITRQPFTSSSSSSSLLIMPSGGDRSKGDHLSRDGGCSNYRNILSFMPSRDENEEEDRSTDGYSVSSSYFDLMDFQASNWIKAMDVPAFGFAAFAIISAITHPILFLAGAATAFGTATAVGAGYDFLSFFCMRPSRDEVMDAEATAPLPQQHDTVGDAAKVEEEPPAEYSASSALPSFPQSTFQLEAVLSRTEDLPENWVEQHYPKLEQNTIAGYSFVGLNVVQFFIVFFADDAPYNFYEFQRRRGDEDIKYGSWKEVQHTVQSLSMHPEAQSKMDDNSYKFFTRKLHFKAKTNNSFIGPAFATTTKIQRFLIISKCQAVLESKTTLADIPFAERFFLMERWIINAQKEDDRYVTTCSMSSQVFFTQSCPFESQIRTKSSKAVKEIAKAWCEMATEALKLAEKSKSRRLQEEQNEFFEEKKESPSFEKQSQVDTSFEVEREANRCIVSNDDGVLSVVEGEPLRKRRGSSIHRALSSLVGKRP